MPYLPATTTQEEITRAVAAIPHWFHSIDLGHGIVTPGDKSVEILHNELTTLDLPDLQGKSVIDIGAWDGFFSWKAESLGASRVVSMDHFVWNLNRTKATEIQSVWQETGSAPIAFEETAAWEPDVLPGKRGYDLAHKVLGSSAECYVSDFLDVDLESLGGPFDVVLWLGVLYHMRNPLLALQKVAAATREVAIIETEAFAPSGFAEHALCEFFERDELGGDFTNWWVPTEQALVGMCRAAGFRTVEVVQGAPRQAQQSTLPKTKTLPQKIKRAGGHVLREFGILAPLAAQPQLDIQHYRAIVHALK